VPTATSTPISTTLSATADSYVGSDHATQNNGTATTLSIDGNSTKIKRAFVAFSVASIPAGSTINSATLTLCETSTTTGRTHVLRLATSTWTETGITWNNQPTVSGTQSASIATTSSLSCFNFTVTADVQSWVNGTANNGWRLNDSDETLAAGSAVNYASRENGTAANRPKLAITYTGP
jgi:hypothetical protein